MIISASSRTDIPAFYGEWFQRRIDAGYCRPVNPFSGKAYRIGLSRAEVDGFVFWTKNLGPFLPKLAMLKERGFPFIVQYTINGYPRELEPAVPSPETSVRHMHIVAQEYGPRVGVWRYDPILWTSLTDFDFHRANFERLAHAMAGAVDQVVVSYACLSYRKARRNLDRAAREGGFEWRDPAADSKRPFLTELASVATSNGMTLRLCAQPEYLTEGVEEAVCIDAQRLSDVAGRAILGSKPGHRGKQCACDYSRDIGAYDTCPHGCVYCYAVKDPMAARALRKRHDPTDEWLTPPRIGRSSKPAGERQLTCWDRQGY